jgi:hypothetical protein
VGWILARGLLFIAAAAGAASHPSPLEASMIRRRALPYVMPLALVLAGPGCWRSTQGGPEWDGGADGAVAEGDAAAHGDGPAPAHDGAPVDGPPADGGAGDGTLAGGRIDIYVAGDSTPKTFTDGLSGQTPRDFKIALSKYYAMTSATDPAPALCFDHGAGEVVANLSGDTLVGSCATATLPTAAYTHGRVRVEWAEYTVSGVLHYLGGAYAGDFTFFRAYSDVVRSGVPMSAGQGIIRFGLTGTEIPVTYPAALQAPGVSVEVTNGECWMTFVYSHPLPVEQTSPDSHWARFTWEIFEGFRWSELALAGYATGAWDVTTVAGGTELVSVPGATGYHTTSSVD